MVINLFLISLVIFSFMSFAFANSSVPNNIEFADVLTSIITFLVIYLIKKVLEVDKHIVEIKAKLEGHNYRIGQIEKKIG